jgi:hypothetical protein
VGRRSHSANAADQQQGCSRRPDNDSSQPPFSAPFDFVRRRPIDTIKTRAPKRRAPAISAARAILAAVLAALLFALCARMPSRAADLGAGEKMFAKCRICHSVAAGAPSSVGLNLHGLF